MAKGRHQRKNFYFIKNLRKQGHLKEFLVMELTS